MRVENWLTRLTAALCAGGGRALLWMLGVFAAIPWHQGRLLALNAAELQLIFVPLLVGCAANWGALHLLAIADRSERPRLYAALRVAVLVVALGAIAGGSAWTLTRIG